MRVWTLSVACEEEQGMGGPKTLQGVGFIDRSGFWKKGSASLTTKLIPVIPVVPASSEFNSRLGLT
jgi:hypothetical protein